MRYILYGGPRRGGRTLAIKEALSRCQGNILHCKRGEKTMLEGHVECKSCHRTYALRMPVDAYAQWMCGAAIQNALPMLSPGERELLISGICEDCFDALTKELDDD